MAKERANEKKVCDKCFGYGVWAVGLPCKMTKEHFDQGMPNKPCPECGSGNLMVESLNERVKGTIGQCKEGSDWNLARELAEELYSEAKVYNIPLELKVQALCDTINKIVQRGDSE